MSNNCTVCNKENPSSYMAGYYKIYEWKRNHHGKFVKSPRHYCTSCVPTKEMINALRGAALHLFIHTNDNAGLRARLEPTMNRLLSEAGCGEHWGSALTDQGYLTEIYNRIQMERKRLKLEPTDRVDIIFSSESDRLARLLYGYGKEIKEHCLINSMSMGKPEENFVTTDIEGDTVKFKVTKIDRAEELKKSG